VEPYSRRCAFCQERAELGMSTTSVAGPQVNYECKTCGRTTSLLPSNLRNVLVAVAVLSLVPIAAGIFVIVVSQDGGPRPLRPLLGGVIFFGFAVVLLVRDARRRRASPVL